MFIHCIFKQNFLNNAKMGRYGFLAILKHFKIVFQASITNLTGYPRFYFKKYFLQDYKVWIAISFGFRFINGLSGWFEFGFAAMFSRLALF